MGVIWGCHGKIPCRTCICNVCIRYGVLLFPQLLGIAWYPADMIKHEEGGVSTEDPLMQGNSASLYNEGGSIHTRLLHSATTCYSIEIVIVDVPLVMIVWYDCLITWTANISIHMNKDLWHDGKPFNYEPSNKSQIRNRHDILVTRRMTPVPHDNRMHVCDDH